MGFSSSDGCVGQELLGREREEGEVLLQVSSPRADEDIITWDVDLALEFSPPQPQPCGRPKKKLWRIMALRGSLIFLEGVLRN